MRCLDIVGVCVSLCRCVLTVCVEKGEDFSLSDAGTQEPGCDEALPLRLPDYTNDLQLTHILLQLGLQVFCRVQMKPSRVFLNSSSFKTEALEEKTLS